jgi:hypothetical protein
MERSGMRNLSINNKKEILRYAQNYKEEGLRMTRSEGLAMTLMGKAQNDVETA